MKMKRLNIVLACCFLITACRKGDGDVGEQQGVAGPDSTMIKEVMFSYDTYFNDSVSIEKYEYDQLKRLNKVTSLLQTPFLQNATTPFYQRDTILFYYQGNASRVSKVIRKINVWNYSYTPNAFFNPVLSTPIFSRVDTLSFGYDISGRVVNDTVVFGFYPAVTDINRYVYIGNIIQAFGQSITNGSSTGEILRTYALITSGGNVLSQSVDGNLSMQLTFDNRQAVFGNVKPGYSFINHILAFNNPFWSFSGCTNNLTQQVKYTPAIPAPIVHTTDYSYTYRSDGYPLIITLTGYLSSAAIFNRVKISYH